MAGEAAKGQEEAEVQGEDEPARSAKARGARSGARAEGDRTGAGTRPQDRRHRTRSNPVAPRGSEGARPVDRDRKEEDVDGQALQQVYPRLRRGIRARRSGGTRAIRTASPVVELVRR